MQEFGDPTTTLVRVERQPGDEEAQMTAVEAVKAAIAKLEPGAKFERTEVVGPKVSGELARAGILAVVLASLAMLAYIWVRFEWPFAVGAIATLVLDVTKTVGFFALTGLDFNLTAIAARAHADRVFGQRQGRGLRPHAREHAAVQVDAASRADRSEHQRDPGAQPLHLGDGLPRLAADGDLGRQGGREFRGADGVRHRDRRELVGVHRGADPAVPRREQIATKANASREGSVETSVADTASISPRVTHTRGQPMSQ